MTAPVEFHGVTKRYGRRRGIEDVSFEVQVGEVFGYLGPNGAGKTTTIRLILDLLRPTEGRVRVLGSDPRFPEVRARIGYLPGELALYDDLTGSELFTFFDHLRGNGWLEHAHRLAERLQLDPSRRIGELSRGNKQKVGLVCALMHRPELLILDEPTSGLDPLIQQEVYRILDEARAGGTTVLFSSHVLTEVERVADRVGIIRQGRLVEVAPLEQLKARARRRFAITFAGPVPIDELARIDGVSHIQVDGSVASCVVEGSVDALIKVLARHEVVNLTSHGADLEGLFLSYYEGEDDAS